VCPLVLSGPLFTIPAFHEEVFLWYSEQYCFTIIELLSLISVTSAMHDFTEPKRTICNDNSLTSGPILEQSQSNRRRSTVLDIDSFLVHGFFPSWISMNMLMDDAHRRFSIGSRLYFNANSTWFSLDLNFAWHFHGSTAIQAISFFAFPGRWFSSQHKFRICRACAATSCPLWICDKKIMKGSFYLQISYWKQRLFSCDRLVCQLPNLLSKNCLTRTTVRCNCVDLNI
jgi:hypothetical protein